MPTFLKSQMLLLHLWSCFCVSADFSSTLPCSKFHKALKNYFLSCSRRIILILQMEKLRQKSSPSCPNEKWGSTPVFHGCQHQWQEACFHCNYPVAIHLHCYPFSDQMGFFGFWTTLPAFYGTTCFSLVRGILLCCGFLRKEIQGSRQILLKYVEHHTMSVCFCHSWEWQATVIVTVIDSSKGKKLNSYRVCWLQVLCAPLLHLQPGLVGCSTSISPGPQISLISPSRTSMDPSRAVAICMGLNI